MKLRYFYAYTWAPDGRSLLTQGRDFKGRWGTYQIDAQTGDLSPLASINRENLPYPKWSPDGKSLYFSRQIPGGKEFALIQWDLASGNEKELIRRVFVGRRTSLAGRPVYRDSQRRSIYQLENHTAHPDGRRRASGNDEECPPESNLRN